MNSTNCRLITVYCPLPDGTVESCIVPVIHRLRQNQRKQIPCAYYIPVIRLPLDPKVKRKLISYTFTYLGHLTRTTQEELEGYPFTVKDLASIRCLLPEYGLSLSPSVCSNKKDWINGNEFLLSERLFPPYLSLQKAWELLLRTDCFDPLTYLDKRLLIPLEYLTEKRIITQGQKTLKELLVDYGYQRDLTTLYLGDVIATQTNLPVNRANFYATTWKAATKKLVNHFHLESCNCGYNWFQPGFERLSTQFFPDNNAIQELLSH